MHSRSYADFDAFEASVSDANHRMILHNPVRRTWKIIQADLPRIHLQVGLEGGGNITAGQARSDGYLIFCPVSNARAHAANGVALDEKSLAVLEPGSDFCLRCNTQHDWCSTFVPTHVLAGGDVLMESSGRDKAACRVVRGSLQAANRFRSFARQVVNAAGHGPHFESTPAAKRLSADMLVLVSSILGQRPARTAVQQGRPAIPRQEVIRRCQQFLEEHGGDPIKAGDLANVADVSARTLRRVFEEYFGVTPTHFLLLRQLKRAHRALKAAKSDETTTSDVLFDTGVYELGRFAARYRQLFGELPSETLKASR